LSLSKLVIYGSIVIFAIIGIFAFLKNNHSKEVLSKQENIQEIELKKTFEAVQVKEETNLKPIVTEPIVQEVKAEEKEISQASLLEANRIEELFALDSKLPIIETITYTSRVPWLKGRPAWIADYASHYSTSRHFIARSLNHKKDYFTQRISPGDKFNVFKKDKNFNFYLLLDLSRSKMWFYYNDLDKNEKVLLKTYNVGLGRKDSKKESGYLTPVGKYSLGSKVAIYKEGTTGYFQDKKIEMIKIFGTRWIPLEKGAANGLESSKGLGIHGIPWINKDGQLVEDIDKIGKYESDGCIRLFSEDMEELFSIIISKPTVIEIVKDFHEVNPESKNFK
jgi:hypothetical protein